MVLIPSLFFFALLAYLHLIDRDALHRPLSMFRDGPLAGFGYTLFGLLVLIGLAQGVAYYFGKRYAELTVVYVLILLLGFVALTPSLNADHGVASILLLMTLYLFYAVRLYLESNPWLFVHFAAPVVILLATVKMLSYGLIQKCLISYLVLAINADCIVVMGTLWWPTLPRSIKRTKKKFKYQLKVLKNRHEG